MNYDKILTNIHKEAIANKDYISKLSAEILKNITNIAEKSSHQKGVFTVLVTLGIYKIVHPKQDIRNHQTQIQNGFSGRSIDTKYITPTLKELGLPSMAESGWLTRSLEQPYPYGLKYEGKISNKVVKKSFLELVHSIEVENIEAKYILVELFKQVISLEKKNKINIEPLKNPEKLTIDNMITTLNKQFSFNYKSFGGSKLPVLAFYAMYQILIRELSRYSNCTLKELGSHTASDRTSKSAGDIELFQKNKLFESIEIKLDKPIDANILRIAKEKIVRFNPMRYYVLSYIGFIEQDKESITQIIEEIKKTHGCQVIVNGVMDTLKYYMRLVENLEEFYELYSDLIFSDDELKTIHKEQWNELTIELSKELNHEF